MLQHTLSKFSSIRLKKIMFSSSYFISLNTFGPLAISIVQLMVKEARLFTFCHWTHGCDAKNYLNTQTSSEKKWQRQWQCHLVLTNKKSYASWLTVWTVINDRMCVLFNRILNISCCHWHLYKIIRDRKLCVKFLSNWLYNYNVWHFIYH